MNLLTTQDAARILGKTERRVQQLCSSGELKATRFGWAWTILPADLRRYMESR